MIHEILLSYVNDRYESDRPFYIPNKCPQSELLSLQIHFM